MNMEGEVDAECMHAKLFEMLSALVRSGWDKGLESWHVAVGHGVSGNCKSEPRARQAGNAEAVVCGVDNVALGFETGPVVLVECTMSYKLPLRRYIQSALPRFL